MKITRQLLIITLLRSTDNRFITAQECIDNPDFRYMDEAIKNCEWISKPSRRARICWEPSTRTNCPVTCGLCCVNNDQPSCVEYKKKKFKNCKDPTIATLCPLMCGVCCYDDETYKFKEKGGVQGYKRCHWLKTRPRKRLNCVGFTKWKCNASCGRKNCFTPTMGAPTLTPTTSSPTLIPTTLSPTKSSIPTLAPTKSSSPTIDQAVEGELTFPPVIDNVVNGVLNMELAHRYSDFSGEVFSMTNARLLNGILPGPTIKVNAGDTLRILYTNEMEDQGRPLGAENTYRYMDHTNLHFHGAHVPGDLPSDDTRMEIPPGSSYQYQTTFPTTHMPGTHWVHPHVHGATLLHVSNGAALALIVKDPPNTLPEIVATAEEVLMLMQDFDLRQTEDVAEDMGDRKFAYAWEAGGREERVRLVNGQYRPVVSARPNQWMRWRVIYAGHDSMALDIRIRSNRCEMVLLAKDGIYIQDFPRIITLAPIPTGGRADLMVRCTSSGTYPVTTFSDNANDPTLTIEVSGTTLPSSNLSVWSPNFPPYLHSLLNTSPDRGCTCSTSFSICRRNPFLGCINREAFSEDESIHSIELGKVVHRMTNPRQHSYHQHVYPFQFIRYSNTRQPGVSQEVQTYFKVGDWHDVIQIVGLSGDVELRFHPREHLGLLMVHCHRLTHEDRGMMSWEFVYDEGEGTCDCNVRARVG